MRLRRQPWVSEALKDYTDIVLLEPKQPGAWTAEFGGAGLLFVELGCGKGGFIAEMAALYPNINFIGVEAQKEVIFKAAQKVRQKGVKNVRLLLFDINNITDIFAQGEVDRFFINFCDPWPKKRHAKRRLTHEGFLQKYRGLLKPQGEIFFKTDNEQLFEFSLNEFARLDLKLKNITFDLHNSGIQNVCTEYEQKFSALGMKIFRCEASFRN